MFLELILTVLLFLSPIKLIFKRLFFHDYFSVKGFLKKYITFISSGPLVSKGVLDEHQIVQVFHYIHIVDYCMFKKKGKKLRRPQSHRFILKCSMFFCLLSDSQTPPGLPHAKEI